MRVEASISVPEIKANGVVVFPEVLKRFPDRLGERHLTVHDRVQAGYHKQKSEGFYPPDMTQTEFDGAVTQDPSLAANDTLVRRDGWIKGRKLVAVSYRDGGYRGVFDSIATGLDRVRIGAAGLHDKELIGVLTRVLAEGFRKDDLDGATLEYVNSKNYPQFNIWCGLLDRLLDKERNLKFAFQGWSTEQREELDHLSQELNVWSGRVLIRMGRYVRSQFVVTDAAVQSGMATERIWQGNTQPSQPYIGEQVGYLINMFDNVSAWKTARDIEPKLLNITPKDVLEKIDEEKTIPVVRRAITAGHELGHVAQVMPKGADLRLGSWYQGIRETYGDGFALMSVTNYPEMIITRGQVPAAVYFDLARSLVNITLYLQKIVETGSKGDIMDPYPYAAAAKINTMLDKKIITVDDTGVYRIADLNQLREESRAYIRSIDKLTAEGSKAEVEDTIMERASHPIDYLATAA